jgi:hypothetical protein
LTKYLEIAKEDFIRNEKAYFNAIDLRQKTKNNITREHLGTTYLNYVKHQVELKSIVSLYTKETAREKKINDRIALIKEKLNQLTQFFIESFRTKRMYKR